MGSQVDSFSGFLSIFGLHLTQRLSAKESKIEYGRDKESALIAGGVKKGIGYLLHIDIVVETVLRKIVFHDELLSHIVNVVYRKIPMSIQ